MKGWSRCWKWLLIILPLLVLFSRPVTTHAYQVAPLPEGNLIQNPWFQSAGNPSQPGFDGWTPVLQDGIGWGLSQKESNPAPVLYVAGKCGNQQVYCGTGARWANYNDEGATTSHPGMDVYLYQVVQADPTARRLNYFMYWVNHKVDIFEVVIYGSNSAGGPWEVAWRPFVLTQDENPSPSEAPGRNNVPWFQTNILETVVTEGFPYYKVELHARYSEAKTNQGDVGVKATGIYFAAWPTEEPGDQPLTMFVHDPTIVPGLTNDDPQHLTPAAVVTIAPVTPDFAGVPEAGSTVEAGSTPETAGTPAAIPGNGDRTRQPTATTEAAPPEEESAATPEAPAETAGDVAATDARATQESMRTQRAATPMPPAETDTPEAISEAQPTATPRQWDEAAAPQAPQAPAGPAQTEPPSEFQTALWGVLAGMFVTVLLGVAVWFGWSMAKRREGN